MRGFALVLLVVVSVVLAILVGKNMSADAGAMLMGFAAGFLAGLPVTLVMLLVGMRRRQRREVPPRAQPPQPTVIVTPGAAQPYGGWPGAFGPAPYGGGGRQFVGDVWDADEPHR